MSLLDFFGNGPDDPRSGQILGLAQGLLSAPGAQGLAAGIGGMNASRDADMRRKYQQAELGRMGMATEKSQMELTQMRDAIARSKAIRDELSVLDRQGGGFPGEPASGGVLSGPAAVRAPLAAPLGFGTQPPVGQSSAMTLPGQPFGTPAQQPQRGPDGRGMSNRLMQQAQVYARNGDFETANKMYENAAKWMPEVHKIEVGMRDGQAVNVVRFKDGSEQVSAFAPAPKTHYLDNGASVLAIDEYTGQQRGAGFQKQMTPGERASNAVAHGNLQVSRDRLAMDRDMPQYMQTEQGIVALPKRPGPGAISAQPVAGPNGEQLGPPLRQIPSSANTAIQGNLQNLQRARTALALVRGQNVGAATGDRSATGWKGYLPNSVLNRADPSGVDARAAIADLGSLVINDRSGAAVTAAEFPRLAPFIPQPTDDAATVEKKLVRFEQVYQQEMEAQQAMYSREQGYKPSPILERAAKKQPDAMPANAMPLPQNVTAQSLQRGQAYQLPNGETAVWDGMRFKGQR